MKDFVTNKICLKIVDKRICLLIFLQIQFLYVFLRKINARMITFPQAKINIGLRIIARRADNYHDIQTIFYPVGLCDALEFVVPANDMGFDNMTMSGYTEGINYDENTVMKTLSVLRQTFKIPNLAIHLHKAIPHGSGLGGGSSDAASFIKLLNNYFKLNLSENELIEISLRMGSDCPFFIKSSPVYAEGKGEIMTALPPVSGNYHLLIIWPQIHISTSEAYENCKPMQCKKELPDFYGRPIEEWKNLIINDFEEIVFKKHPEIREIKNSLYDMGALYSSMSGSGSAVYGIFRNKPENIPAEINRLKIYSGPL
mgnify:FL=1